jgi:hypothetical protein
MPARVEQPPNTACSGQVGTRRIFKHFSSFGFFLLPNRIHARPPAGNASRWLASNNPDIGGTQS